MENVKQEKRLSLAAKPMSRDQLLTAGDLFDFKLQLLFEIKTLLKEQKSQSNPTLHYIKRYLTSK
jgi:hypothetical protein